MADTLPSQDFIEIADIKNSLVLLKDGSLRSVIEVESVNFDLKSNDEQSAIVAGYQNFLNSIDFPLQIVINSRKLNMANYVKYLKDIEPTVKSDLLRMQLGEYGKFVQGLAELANIMTKRFFVVIPYYSVETAKQSKGVMSSVKSFFSSASHHMQELSLEDIKKYEAQVEQRIGVVIAGLSPLGVTAKVLKDQELIDVYQRYYNLGQEKSI
jgi:type IV secretory pathway VirB4 component